MLTGVVSDRIVGTTLLIGLVFARAGHAQQGHVQITGAAQTVVADPERRAGQQSIEPDFGLALYQPGFPFGTLSADIHATRRGDRAHVGQSAIGLRDVKVGGLVWSFTAGDTFVSPPLADYSFTNLSAPQVSFSGANLSGFSPRGSLTATAGRVTALRNIFGSDPQTLGQDVGQLRARLRPSPRVELLARSSRVRTRDVKEFGYYIEEADDFGAGTRVRVAPTLELTADLGMSRYRRRGSARHEQSPTALVGAHWAAPRGWVQVNAQRFAPGYFAVLNTPYLDRAGAFAAAEFELWSRLRLFGGFEAYRTNLDPEASALAATSLPRGLAQRGFGGARLHIAGPSFLTVRAEDGDRSARPVHRTGAQFDSDTGVVSVDFQTGSKTVSAFVRYERRENIDTASGLGSYAQHTSTAQLFARMGTSAHLFASAMAMQRERGPDAGQTFWQTGGGFQWKLPGRQLWLRSEGVFSRSEERDSDRSLPHQLFNAGLSGQLTPRTAIAFDVSLDRAPLQLSAASPWLARSMLRLMHTLPTGSVRVETASRRGSPRRRGSGSLFGLAFADWNGNGNHDPGEETLRGVPFVFGARGIAGETARTEVWTGPDGQFAFVNVPLGRASVSLDLAALPVDFDPPEQATRETQVRRRGGERLAFGLIPLGTIAGSVVHDENGDGTAGAGEAAVDGAVVLLNAGLRSEQTRGGAFRFEAVRPGAHELTLLEDSLPEGAAIAGKSSLAAEIDRERPQIQVVFLVKLEKRNEIRKVFPPIRESSKP